MATDGTFEDAGHTTLLGSPTPLSSNFGYPKGSAPDLERTGSRLGTMEKINEIYLQLPLFLQNASRIENCVQTLSQTVASKIAKITSVEQIDSSVAARVATLETGAASASSGSGAARSWNLLGQADGSIAAGCLGPGPSDENRNTRRRLDTFSNPDDENARSAVMLQFPCEQSHAGVSVWLWKFWATTNVPSFNRFIRIHCKRVSQSATIAFEREPSEKTLWRDTRMMVFFMRLRVLLQYQRNLGASIQIAIGPRNWETFCATVGSSGFKTTRNLPWQRC